MKKLKKLYKNKYLPFIIFFIILLVLHMKMDFFGDDLKFASYKMSVFKFLSWRYFHWSSRLVTEFCLYYLVRININVWRILNCLIYTIGVFVLMKLINKKEDTKFNYLGCLLFLIYPYTGMGEAGWVATTTNYLWCFGLGMLSFIPFINKQKGKNTSKILYIISIIGLIYGANHEQGCAVIFGINILYLINTIFIKKEKIDKYNLVCTILSGLILIFIFTCPGNTVRLNDGHVVEFLDWDSYSFIQKIYYGIVPTMQILFGNKIYLLLLSIVLMIGVFSYGHKNFSKFVAVINLCFVSVSTIFYDIFVNTFSVFAEVFKTFTLQDRFYLGNSLQVLAFLIGCLIFLNLIYMTLVIFGKNKLLPVSILIIGICSRIMMGFSNTIFISGTRTAMYLYMCMITVILFVLYKLYSDKKINSNLSICFFGVLAFLAFSNFISLILTI